MKLKLYLLILMVGLGQLLYGQETVSGTVTDAESGDPLIGASVLIEGTTNGTVTDLDGNYTLSIVPEAVLVFSYTGYTTQTIPWTPGTSELDVMLSSGVLFDEVVVTGYASERKRDLLGAVAVIDLEEIQDVANPNVMQSIQGRTAGVFVDLSGDPGQGARVQVRGTSTLNNNNPLYIVDGVPIEPFNTDALGTGYAQSWGLSWLNPSDVESVQVLKDASSSSIYGSRASNGVVIITTRRPKAGDTKINVNVRTSVENWFRFDDLTNNRERAIVEWQGAVNDGSDPNATGVYTYEWHLDPTLGPGIQGTGVPVLDRVIYPEWLDESDQLRPAGSPNSVYGGDIEEGVDYWDEISQTGIIQNYDISFTQGTERGGVMFSANFFDQKGVVIETGYERYGLRLNSFHKFLNDRVTIGENLAVARESREILDNGFGGSAEQAPYRYKSILPVRTEDGRFSGPPGGGFSDRDNPVALAFDNQDDLISNVKIFGNVYANIELLDGLFFNTNFGVDYDNINTRNLFRTYSRGFLANNIAELTESQNQYASWVFNNTLSYQLERGESNFNFLAGTEAIESTQRFSSATGKDFALETNEYFQLGSAAGERTNDGGETGFSLFSIFGKFNYSYASRYLASFTLRRDGSSRFGANNRYAIFPAASLGWRISEEPFLANNNLISNLKLRLAYGQTGNQFTANDATLGLYRAVYAPQNVILPWGGGCAEAVCPDAATAYDIGNQDSGILPSGFLAIQTANPDLKWETSTEYNFGLDFGLSNDALTGSFEVFQKQTEDILIVPTAIGAFGDGARRFVNAADLKTTGWELAIQYNSLVKSDFGYSIGTNFGSYKSTITDLPEDLYTSYPGNQEQNIIGQAPNAFFGYRTDGIFQNEAEVEAHAEQTGKRVGALRFVDLNNDGVISVLDQEYDDSRGNGVADVQFGVNVRLDYKNFDLTLFGWGALGRTVAPDVFRMELGSLNNGENGGVAQLDAWSPTNTGSYIPAVSNSNQPFGFSLDYNLRNGNFFAFRQATLGYTLAEGTGLGGVFSNLRVYLSGENLAWIVDRKGPNQFPHVGWRVENSLGGLYPKPLRVSLGINAGF
ncbi:TonB-linked SusC/RagA family outer membrane protein [Lewinella aquimaris]|uniref:TonB-linked SusC/RagA family outer membrane protein n=1 Tax=Neolewinella aquimaris TaxID=1835722 RepID=A0A840DZQ7_9BACT|nr:SusC/RagA family TonB-linked outer membrane protein [Neolewinella aquimaris]MBB4078754.1 TonB-linked SusC/RagA family outer membrane protein [Neolewinella aquimaris]